MHVQICEHTSGVVDRFFDSHSTCSTRIPATDILDNTREKRIKTANELLDKKLVEEAIKGSPEVYRIILMLRRFTKSIHNKKRIEQLINDRLPEARELIDEKLIENAVNGYPEVQEIIMMLKAFNQRVDNRKTLGPLLSVIPPNRLEANILFAIKSFCDNDSDLKYLSKLVAPSVKTIEDYLIDNARLIEEDSQLLRFVEWCQYDLNSEVKRFFDSIKQDERLLKVISQRADGITLNEIGNDLGISRERVRQIEKKVCQRWRLWQNKNQIMEKLFLDLKEENGLLSTEVRDYIDLYGKECVYFLKLCGEGDYYYDQQADMFIIGKRPLSDTMQTYVDSLPESFAETEMNGYLQTAAKEYGYPPKRVKALIESKYRKTGKIYHKQKLTIEKMYSYVLATHYKEGICVYNEKEIEQFRQFAFDDYGIDISRKSTHSIGSFLAQIGIPCGRGKYKPCPEENLISSVLAKRIYDYIKRSKDQKIMIDTLFSVFKEDLLREGINNKYLLKGILKVMHESEWFFGRDYIIREDPYTNKYKGVVEIFNEISG